MPTTHAPLIAAAVILASCLASSCRAAQAHIAIFKDDIPAQGIASDPDRLASIISRAGFSVGFLDSEQLADPAQLNSERTRVVILPYGASFPLKAAENFRRFLRAGGDFISIGSYAFDNLLARDTAGRWVSQDSMLLEAPIEVGGDFESGAGPWKPTDREACSIVRYNPHSGQRCARVVTAEPRSSAEWFYELKPTPGVEYHLSGWVRYESQSPTGYAFMAWYQFDSQGKIVSWRDIALSRESHPWQFYSERFPAAEGAVLLRLRIGIYEGHGTAWFDDVSLTARPAEVVMNTAKGEPADALTVKPEQVGVFDLSYPLERAKSLRGTGTIFPASLDLAGPFEGWAASAVLGWNEARWTSLLDTFDRYGRPRGSAAALVRNYAGYYRGSSWAIFGITNRDLFSRDSPLCEHLPALLRLMDAETFMHNLSTDLACYKDGEPVKIAVNVTNFSPNEQPLRLSLLIEPMPVAGPKGAPVSLPAIEAQMQPGETRTLDSSWAPPRFDSDLYRIAATLEDNAGVLDQMETGFTVEKSKVIASGPPLSFKDNYITLAGKRHFWLGTDTYSNILFSAHQNPLTLHRHLQLAKDHGIAVWETLLPGPAALPKPYRLPREYDRAYMALAQLTQRHGMLYVPGLLIGYDVGVSNAELARQAAYCANFARRFKSIPAIMYYINGDLAMRSFPDEARRLFMKSEPGVEPKQMPGAAWNDMQAVRHERFAAYLTRRWLANHHLALRQADPAHPTTVEYYAFPLGGIDLRASLGPVSLGNMGFFDLKGKDVASFPGYFKFSDTRIKGRGLSIGEFGVKTHPAWAESQSYHQTRTHEEQQNLFLAVTHYVLALGGCKVHNWCWQDAPEWVFPWGLVHAPDALPKDILRLYRNIGFLFRLFEPVDRRPQVCLISPESNRLGPGSRRIYDAVTRSIDALIACRVPFEVVSEQDLDAIPSSARLLVYPIPYCPTDEVFDYLMRIVRNGACLYFSGDISFGPDRKRNHSARLRTLAGVRIPEPASDPFAAAKVPPTAVPLTARPLKLGATLSGKGKLPAAFVNQVGKGQVLFTPSPEELRGDTQPLVALYNTALTMAGTKPLDVASDSAALHSFDVPVQSGKAWALFNADPRAACKAKVPAKRGPLTIGLAPHKPGFVLEDSAGRLIALEAAGKCERSGRALVDCPSHFILASLDGRDITESEALVLMVSQPCTVRLANSLRPPIRRHSELRAEVGEVREGKWVALETFPLTGGAIEIDEDRALEMILIAPEARLQRWGNKVASLLSLP